jgi:hypothetical protein
MVRTPSSRAVLLAGIVFLVLFFALGTAFALHGGVVVLVVVVVALAALIGAGNLLYGRDSHGAAAQERVRPAQEAHDRAAARAADARRAVAEANQRGERFCPLDPAHISRSAEPAHRSDAS